MKVAIVYDRVVKWGGAERVLLVLHEMFGEAELFTSVYDKKNARWASVFSKIHTSFLQKIPFAKTNHEKLAFLMPVAFEQFNFDGYDLVISVTSEAAKGIITGPKTRHVCYLLTPTRYLWSGHENYFSSGLFRFLAGPVVGYLRKWDRVVASRPDKIIAISTAVKKRIKEYYGRDSQVIYPPVAGAGSYRYSSLSGGPETTSRVSLPGIDRDYYLVVSRLVKYKRVELVVRTFNELGLPLVIVGTGREGNRLKSVSKKNIKFAGGVSDKMLRKYYENCKALVFVQEEDFGLVAVEAMSFGKPVIAYRAGGALDTVIDGETGVFFEAQTEKDLTKVVGKFDRMKFDSVKIKKHAKTFSKERFKRDFQKAIG